MRLAGTLSEQDDPNGCREDHQVQEQRAIFNVIEIVCQLFPRVFNRRASELDALATNSFDLLKDGVAELRAKNVCENATHKVAVVVG